MTEHILDDAQSTANTTHSHTTAAATEFNFSGKTNEFFGIWIVNVLLSIVTLGIYSAWAKVRTYQYFYGNTELDGHSFSYLATPMQILKGRIIAVAFFLLYYIVSSMFPIAGLFFMLVLLAVIPWAICSSLRFNLRMTSYRNVRFNFSGKYGDALINFIILPVASVFTLYLLMPWVLKRIDNFMLSNTHYGDKQFQPKLSTGHYYITALMTVILSVGLFAVFGVIAAMVGGFSFSMADGEQMPASFSLMSVLFIAVYVALISLVSAYYQASIRNHVFANTKLPEVANFDSNFAFTSLAWLQFTNVLAIMCTLGLAYPWTRIRKARYAVEHTQVFALAGKDQVIDQLGDANSAIGDEVANAFDIDVALT